MALIQNHTDRQTDTLTTNNVTVSVPHLLSPAAAADWRRRPPSITEAHHIRVFALVWFCLGPKGFESNDAMLAGHPDDDDVDEDNNNNNNYYYDYYDRDAAEISRRVC